MNKNETIAVVVSIAVIGAWAFFGGGIFSNSKSTREAFDPKNATYFVDGQAVRLKDGISMVSIPNSSSVITTQYFGNSAIGDISGDGINDYAFLLTQNSGGSGTFFYVVSVLGGTDKYTVTNTVFLGDRIAPQTTQIQSGRLIVNFADRNPGEPMSTRPSVGVSRYFESRSGLLIEIK